VLRVENLGPDGFSVSPADKVSCWYEAGVRECRLIRTGTVRFTITHSQAPRPLTVVVAEPSSPPGQSTAGMGARTYTVDEPEKCRMYWPGIEVPTARSSAAAKAAASG